MSLTYVPPASHGPSHTHLPESHNSDLYTKSHIITNILLTTYTIHTHTIMYALTYTYIDLYTYTHTYKYMHTYTYTYMHTNSHTRIYKGHNSDSP